MQLQLDADDARFRDEVRQFLRDTLPEDVRKRSSIAVHPPSDADRRWWNRVLHDKGWVAARWPVEHGGPGWSALRVHLFEYECRMAGAPELRWQGLRLLGPVLYTFGTAAQKARFFPGILGGQTMWGQGFSEPSAGSDLASLRTSAVLEGDHFIVNGQKVWTTEADESEWGFFLVRTEPTGKPQQGISMLLIDLASPGVTVRGIPTINGGCATCEVFLEDVRVPADQLVGARGSGWSQARFLLGNERTASADIEKSWADLRHIHRLASEPDDRGRTRLDDPLFMARLAEVELLVEALEWSVLRVLCDAPSSHPIAARASMLKVRGSEIQQRLNEIAVMALGPRSLRMFGRDEAFAHPAGDPLWTSDVPGVVSDLLYQRALTIYGGAREVQKNIIFKLAFGG